MNVLQLAGMLARDPQFIDWVGQWTVPPRSVTADEAAQFIRMVCKVESRRELATDREARAAVPQLHSQAVRRVARAAGGARVSNKGKVIDGAIRRLYEASLNCPPWSNIDLIRELIGQAYDAGRIDTPDDDAARWRMFKKQFGSMRARMTRHVYFPTRAVMEYHDSAMLDVKTGASWRFECGWTERTGDADTIPKFIDVVLKEHRNQTKD